MRKALLVWATYEVLRSLGSSDTLDPLFPPPDRDHSVADGLDYVSAWNASMLNSSDFVEVFSAAKEKRKPVFSKL